MFGWECWERYSIVIFIGDRNAQHLITRHVYISSEAILQTRYNDHFSTWTNLKVSIRSSCKLSRWYLCIFLQQRMCQIVQHWAFDVNFTYFGIANYYNIKWLNWTTIYNVHENIIDLSSDCGKSTRINIMMTFGKVGFVTAVHIIYIYYKVHCCLKTLLCVKWNFRTVLAGLIKLLISFIPHKIHIAWWNSNTHTPSNQNFLFVYILHSARYYKFVFHIVNPSVLIIRYKIFFFFFFVFFVFSPNLYYKIIIKQSISKREEIEKKRKTIIIIIFVVYIYQKNKTFYARENLTVLFLQLHVLNRLIYKKNLKCLKIILF